MTAAAREPWPSQVKQGSGSFEGSKDNLPGLNGSAVGGSSSRQEASSSKGTRRRTAASPAAAAAGRRLGEGSSCQQQHGMVEGTAEAEAEAAGSPFRVLSDAEVRQIFPTLTPRWAHQRTPHTRG